MTNPNQRPPQRYTPPASLQIYEPAAAAVSMEKVSPSLEHRRWKSDPARTKRAMENNVFSYEYRFEDGRLAGLAEYHPDQDYMHYISSRSTSRTASTIHSSRTSREEMLAPPRDEYRKSSSSQTSSQASPRLPPPPPSPRKTEVLKRALSLHSLKRRPSSVDERRRAPPSPYSRPEIEQLAASFGPNGPQHITAPVMVPPEVKFDNMFEAPRSAPLPPSRKPLIVPVRPEVPREPRASESELVKRMDSSQEGFVSPRKLYAQQSMQGKDLSTSPITIHMARKIVNISLPASPPAPMRRKASRFIEHIETREKPIPVLREEDEEEADQIPPVPPMILTPVEFTHPVSEVTFSTPDFGVATAIATPQPPASPIVRRASIVRVTSTSVSPKTDEGVFQSAPETTSSMSPMARPVSPLSDADLMWPLPPSNSTTTTLRRSSSTMMAAAPCSPGHHLPKRSASTTTRPTPIVGGVCMAQIRPVLASPIVAQGHARMIFC